MVCENCKESSELKPGFTFLGFPTMKCPKCNHYNVYQLSNGRRNFYIFLIVVGLLAIIGGLATGHALFPGILFIAAVWAIVSDNKKRKNDVTPQVVSVATPATTATQGKDEFCGQCGAKLDADAVFCPGCGAKAKP